MSISTQYQPTVPTSLTLILWEMMFQRAGPQVRGGRLSTISLIIPNAHTRSRGPVSLHLHTYSPSYSQAKSGCRLQTMQNSESEGESPHMAESLRASKSEAYLIHSSVMKDDLPVVIVLSAGRHVFTQHHPRRRGHPNQAPLPRDLQDHQDHQRSRRRRQVRAMPRPISTAMLWSWQNLSFALPQWKTTRI
jgi:hypothetical protein